VRGHRMRGWAAVLGGGFLLAALVSPKVLAPLNRVWTALGLALHRITNPLILGVCFYLVFTPLGWFLRWLGKDFLRLKRSPSTASYWIPRDPPGPEPESIANQF
jgi:saxitoxin biosynthesis operon SxtJ-like protein